MGYVRYAPGTLASLAGVVLSFFLREDPVLGAAVFIFLFLAGLIASGKTEKRAKQKDPSHIVIDEFSCALVVFFLLPMDIITVPAGFILYRLFDILKPPPVSFAEKLKGGWGIMLDDLLSGVFAHLLLRAVLCFL